MEKILKIGIVGCGAIGSELALFIKKKLKGKAKVTALCDFYPEKARALNKRLSLKADVLSLNSLIPKVDLVIESASIEGAKEIIKEALAWEKDVIILSVGVLVERENLLSLVKDAKSNIYIPSGAIGGIDALGALAQGRIKKIVLTTTKPPFSLKGAPYLEKRKLDISRIKKEKVIFRGKIREAIKYFPKNINISATLFLASQYKDIEVIIKVNPRLKRNVHHLKVIAQEANFTFKVENFPSPQNPKTSYLAILSVESLLKKITGGLKVGG